MATPNHTPIGTGRMLPLPTLREFVWKRKPVVPAVMPAWTNNEEECIRLRARDEAHAWQPAAAPGKLSILQEKWKQADAAIGRASEELQTESVHERRTSPTIQLFVESVTIFWAALRETREVLASADKLPQVEKRDAAPLPRVYAVARDFLGAVGYEFDLGKWMAYLDGVQGHFPLAFQECWTLKPFVQLVLLERAGAIANGLTSETVLSEGQDESEKGETTEASLATIVESLRRLIDLESKEIFARTSQTEKILEQDPAGAYSQMDLESREVYCRAVSEMAAQSGWSETAIATKAVALAIEAHRISGDSAKDRKSHVGYYLTSEGVCVLRDWIGYQSSFGMRVRETALRLADFWYLAGIELGTIAVIALVLIGARGKLPGFIELLLFVLPAVECAVAVMNTLATQAVAARALPKLDFSNGIPDNCATVVVVPTLAINEEQVRHAVSDLEVRYLANHDRNLQFALLTDPPDSVKQFDEKDELAPLCSRLIRDLNEKYGSRDKGGFFHFHRHRAYNPSEKIWMGWERKRGKLLDFNNFLLGVSDNFPVKEGNFSLLRNVKYVITLDLDTELPRGAAQRLVGAIAHPLNRAVIDPASNRVVRGYGILQPRVEISIKSAVRSRLAAIFSGDTGFDIYTRAVSDVYQDLFQEGIFTGKGIYEVETFQRVVEHRFPCNTLLSHDLIEGAYARAGLVSDVEVVDDYPSHFSAFSRRKHRWVRGDWQIIFWLLPRVPDYFGKIVRNPLNLLSRWKIIDNLRRSLTEFATFVLLLAGWLFLPGNPVYWTLVTLAIVAFPTYFEFMLSIARAGRARFTGIFWKNLALDFASANERLFFRITFLCHQGLVTLDAVIRTLIRLAVTHQRLLEWETAAEAEVAANKRKSPVEVYLEWTPLISFLLAVVVAAQRPAAFAIALPFLSLWAASKMICGWLSHPYHSGRAPLRTRDASMLRRTALRTWRFFHEHSSEKENWLVPDIVQETPLQNANNISPTNLGFLLTARLAACDLGFLTLPEFIDRTEKTFGTVDRMAKFRGHLYNWYDTRTLEPLAPLFVSTVDNGNLVCCLWTLARGCAEMAAKPLFSMDLRQGLIDHLEVIEELVAKNSVNAAIAGAICDFRLEVSDARPESAWVAISDWESKAKALLKKMSETEITNEEKWWTNELSQRLSNLRQMAEDCAPWLLTKFASCPAVIGICAGLRLEDLTLQSASGIYDLLSGKIREALARPEMDSEDRSILEHLNAVIERAATIAQDLSKRLMVTSANADALASGMDFGLFYSPSKKLLAIGFDTERGKASDCHYDLLASEARSAVFVAIAKGEVPRESWLQLGRLCIARNAARGLVSWTGTMFEYLLPALWMKSYPGTILERSARAALRIQQAFTSRTRVPWGISECSSSERNPDGFYRYKAFGVPALALCPEKMRDLVISPYSTFLGLQVDAARSIKNLRKMDSLGWQGTYGFYEAADFTPSRVKNDGGCEIVRCWMAHHQGMTLTAIVNALCESPMKRRFHAEPMVAATERLLHEKFPRVATMKQPREDETSAHELLSLDQQRLLHADLPEKRPAAGSPDVEPELLHAAAATTTLSPATHLADASHPPSQDHILQT